MAFLGFGLMVVGGFVVDCAYKNRPPLQTLVAIVSNPTQYQTILASSSRGAATVPPQAPTVAAPPTTTRNPGGAQ